MFDLGDTVPLAADLRDAAGALTNATTAVLTITLPDGTTATPPVTNPPAITGRYTVDYVPVQTGHHKLRWAFSSPTAAHEDTFHVNPPLRSVVSLQEVRAHLNLTGTDHDEELRLLMEAATDVVEYMCGPVVRRTVTQVVSPGAVWWLTGPVLSVTSVLDLDGGTLNVDLDDLELDTAAGTLSSRTGWPITYTTARITYVTGRVTVPATMRLAALIIIEHLWETQRGAGLSNLQGYGGDMPAPNRMGFAIPNRARDLLAVHASAPQVA